MWGRLLFPISVSISFLSPYQIILLFLSDGNKVSAGFVSDGMGMIFYYGKRGAFLIVQLNAFMGNVHRMPPSGVSSHTNDSVSCVVRKYLIYDNL